MRLFLLILGSICSIQAKYESRVDKFGIEEELDDLWSYESFVDRDHMLVVGNKGTDDSHFHFDRLVGTIVKPGSFHGKLEYTCPDLVPLYQHYDANDKHHFSTIYIPKGHPIGYCAPGMGICEADTFLAEYNGEPTDYTGNQGKDSYYGEKEEELWPYLRDYEKNSTWPVCYIWSRSAYRFKKDKPVPSSGAQIRHLFQHLVPLHVFHNPAAHDHIYDIQMRNPVQHIGIIGHIIKKESGPLIQGSCALLPLTISHRKQYDDWDMVNSEYWYNFRFMPQFAMLFDGTVKIGWAFSEAGSCSANHQLGIYHHEDLVPFNEDVYVIPPGFEKDPIWADMKFWVL